LNKATTAQNINAMVTWHPVFVHPLFLTSLMPTERQKTDQPTYRK